MPPIKSEPIENPSEMKSPTVNYLPDIKSETFEYSPDVKLENVEYSREIAPSKRLKTLSSATPSPPSKGKSIIQKEEEDDDSDSSSEQQLGSCGVCLLEEGMSLRGFIDSCEHYFCFVCIMEWAKVESRCPICKRRFSTIRRPIRDGVFLSERIVNIPVRDQVYFNNGNATLGPTDPYSQVKCSVCSLSTDDNLLLLCDLCDSAAHSFCVGLGATVPEGDWFCHDCTLSRDEHAKTESDTTCDNNNYNNNTYPSSFKISHFTHSNVSIHDIVRESDINEPDTSSAAPSLSQSQPIVQRSDTSVDRTSNARTLKRCQNVHARIKILRENWDGFRGGSLNFASSFRDRVNESQTQSSSSNQVSTSQRHTLSYQSPTGGSYNVDKAWKMMDIASKALGKKSGNKSINKDLKHPVKTERLLKEASKIRPNIKHFGSRIAFEPMKNCSNNGQILSRKDCIVNKSNVVGSSGPPSRLIISPSITTDKCCPKKEINATSEEKGRKKDPQFDSNNIKKFDDAKSEIQSLVKLNLKLLSKDKKLEVNVFKEVARHATHSILAACGIELPKPGFRIFQSSICKHDEAQKRSKSTLMPSSCRECFFVFVKDVVTTIAIDRTSSLKS